VINMHSQPINSSILKNPYQVKQETYMNKKKLNINLVQYLWLDLNQERIDQVLLLNIGYLWKQLNPNKNIFKNEYMVTSRDFQLVSESNLLIRLNRLEKR
jgi:hypothetical protein